MSKFILADAYMKFKKLGIVQFERGETSITFNGTHYIITTHEKDGTTIAKIPKSQMIKSKPYGSINDFDNDKVYYVIFNPDTKEVFILWLTFEQFGTEKIPKYVS